MARQERYEDDDTVFLSEIEFSDDTELRRVVSVTEDLLDSPTRDDQRTRLRVSPLSEEQWGTVIAGLPAALRRGQEKHLHILPARREPQHLLVSTSAVQGLNERSTIIYHEIISSLVRAVPSPLCNGVLRRGVNEVLIEEVGRRVSVRLTARAWPAEAAFVGTLLRVLVEAYGHSELEWATILRNKPDRLLLALRRSDFGAIWLRHALRVPDLAEALRGAGNRRRVILCEMVASETFSTTCPLADATLTAALAFLSGERA